MNISRKKLLFMSITIIMMILLSSIFAFSSANFKPKYGVSTERINFRKQANLNSSSIVKTIDKDTDLKVVGEVGDFYVVQLKTNEVGLVSKEYTKITEGNGDGYLTYENLTKQYATVNSNVINLRGGPGTNFASYSKLYLGNKVEIIGRINEWYMVVTENNRVGMIREDLLDNFAAIEDENSSNSDDETTSTLPNTAQTVLDLINKARSKANVTPLQVNDLLASTAQAKANDMVENNYFSHESPSYGSPFEMMQNAGITYKTAGENIAGNSSVENAVNSWLASDTHKQNILSNAYNYVGIGITKSDTYGYVIVVMFIGK